TIMHLIDILAELKYNEFQLYMESFCFKYETLNEYTKDLNCLDADDIKILDQYCADRFIDFVLLRYAITVSYLIKLSELIFTDY
ncbi:MAG: hypothetical protein IKV88_02990, partial [Clostridia bacterium]|nr:hypothetical protein [Clostridia bacterium]